jgi:hypothetical protein
LSFHFYQVPKKSVKRQKGEKGQVNFEKLESKEILMLPIKDIWRSVHPLERLKYQKDYEASFKDIPAMPLKKLTQASIFLASDKECCTTQFCERPIFGVDRILSLRKEFWLLKAFDSKGPCRRSWMTHTLNDCWNQKKEGLEYKLSGHTLCQKAFIQLLGVSKKFVQTIGRDTKATRGELVVKRVCKIKSYQSD